MALLHRGKNVKASSFWKIHVFMAKLGRLKFIALNIFSSFYVVPIQCVIIETAIYNDVSLLTVFL